MLKYKYNVKQLLKYVVDLFYPKETIDFNIISNVLYTYSIANYRICQCLLQKLF